MGKQVYEKPLITKLKQGKTNKYGSSPYFARRVRKEIDGVTIDDLVEQFGSPLFVFSEQAIRNKVKELKANFACSYPNVTFGWSYKTNYLDAICSIFHQEGCIAEVVSEMEYQKARRLGVKGSDIIFNGPNKSMEILEIAVKDGAKIHVDHLDEIEDLEKIAKKLNKKIDIGMRLNLDSGILPLWTRFGFNLESGQAYEVIKRIQDKGLLNLVGLHCHIGTFILDPYAYKRQIIKMVNFGYELKKSLGVKIKYYDIGGGMPSKSKLKGSYYSPDILVPDPSNYIDAISEAMYESLQDNDFPMLYLENGRALIDEAGYLITSVVTSKRLPDGRKSYVIDAGVNMLYTSTWYQFNIELDREVVGIGEPSILNGPLCMNIDIVDDNAMLPSMSRGTRLILSPVGAYNVTQWMQFIEFRPAIVLITRDGNPTVIREKEELKDLVSKEKIPSHLKNIK